jgi:hypothetical protein
MPAANSMESQDTVENAKPASPAVSTIPQAATAPVMTRAAIKSGF